jgi:hypothetical protein
MKKIFSIAALAAVTLFAASCVKSNVGTSDEVGNTGITVKISGPAATRAVLDAGSTNLAPEIDETLESYIYVVQGDGGAVLHFEALDVDEAMTPGTGQKLADGDKIFPTNAEVYILANIPADVTIPGDNFASMADIAATESLIIMDSGTNSDWQKPAMANQSGDSKPIVPLDAANNEYQVSIDITPLYGRIELHGVEGGASIDKFTITGVYVDDYFRSFNMIGQGTGDLNSKGQDPVFTGWWGDPCNLTWDRSASTDLVVPATDKVWAFHFGGGSIVRFILAVKDVEYNDAEPDPINPRETEGFVTVKGYNVNAPFTRGNIYVVESLSFNKVGKLPNDELVGITANVKIKNWNVVPVNPSTK